MENDTNRNNPRITKAALARVGTLLISGLLTSGNAAAQTPTTPAFPAAAATTQAAARLTAEQWKQISQQAAAAGDIESALAASQAAEHSAHPAAESNDSSRPEIAGIIGRMAIKAALKYGGAALPESVRSWAGKLYDLVDAIDLALSQSSIALFLTSQGIPPDQALYIAQWLYIFS